MSECEELVQDFLVYLAGEEAEGEGGVGGCGGEVDVAG